MRRKSQIKGVDASTERENLKNLPSRTKQPEKGSTPLNIFRGTLKLETSHLNLLRDLDSARICMKKVSKKNATKQKFAFLSGCHWIVFVVVTLLLCSHSCN